MQQSDANPSGAPAPGGYYIFDPIDPFENIAGPFFVPENSNEAPVFYLRTGAEHCNRHGIIHGGLMMTMADLCICVVARHGTDDNQIVTVSMNNDFIDSGYSGDVLCCRAEVLRRSGSLCFMSAKVSVDDRTLLNVNAVVKRLRNKSS